MTSIAEKRARARAISEYSRYLLKVFGRIDLVELAAKTDVVDPISLQKVFVPLRASEEPISDAELFKDETDVEEEREKLPGRDVFDLLVENDFVALSGMPGSGKSTLVQALVVELCGKEVGDLRRRLPALPVPLILRRFPNLGETTTFDELLEMWWEEHERQAVDKGFELDRERIERWIHPEDPSTLEHKSVLLLFDGIDEIGGAPTRLNLLRMAREAHDAGYRVLVTGRPAGYRDLTDQKGKIDEEEIQELERKLADSGVLDVSSLVGLESVSSILRPALERMRLAGSSSNSLEELRSMLSSSIPVTHHLLGFSWPQIETFIEHWYRLRDDWLREREEGVADFLDHLREPHRRPLLVLARRPIFITLMALVHCTHNRMPAGRAKLYEEIIDLYLQRQERFRKQRKDLKGTKRKWNPELTQPLLGFLARESQERGSGETEGDNPEVRRYRWEKIEVIELLQEHLESSRAPGLGPDDAEHLLEFFLHPVGLLVAPAEDEVQFAHLSFQEYLCAWEIHEEAKLNPVHLVESLKTELFKKLHRPGWNEVGVLAFHIYSENTRRRGHLDLLSELDLDDPDQAELFVRLVAGQELEWVGDERERFLPAAMAACLVHPERKLGIYLAALEQLKEPGLEILLDLLEVEDTLEMWSRLEVRAPDDSLRDLVKRLGPKWEDPPDGSSWRNNFGASEARVRSLLTLVNSSGFGVDVENIESPIRVRKLEEKLYAIIGASSRAATGILSLREEEQTQVTNAALELDPLVGRRGPLQNLTAIRAPWDLSIADVDAGVAKGAMVSSRPPTLFGFYGFPDSRPLPRGLITMTWCVWYCDVVATVDLCLENLNKRLHYLLGSFFRSFFRASDLRSDPATTLHTDSYRRLESQSRRFYETIFRSAFRSFSLSQTQSFSRPLSLSRSLLLSVSFSTLFNSTSDFRSLVRTYSRGLLGGVILKHWSNKTRGRLSRLFNLEQEGVNKLLEVFAAHCAALASLREVERQAKDHDLAHWRGFDPAEPVPGHLHLVDEEGFLRNHMPRSSVERLREWLHDDEEVLAWGYPDGCDPEEEQFARDELAHLKTLSWSPHQYVEAILEDWPEDEPERDISREAGERRMIEVIEKVEEELGLEPLSDE